MSRPTRAGLLALALPSLFAALLLTAPQGGTDAALFTQRPIPVDHPQHLVVADFNQDGYDDLAIANFEAGTVTILINQQDGTFLPHKDSPNLVGGATVGQPTGGPLFLVVGDLDPEDVDGDEVANLVDNCPNVYNPADGAGVQADTDSNQVGDACQVDPTLDGDGDGFHDYDPDPAKIDNCPRTYNPGSGGVQDPEAAAGLDGVCNTADDNVFLYTNGVCGTQTFAKVGAACSRSADLVILDTSSGGGSPLGLVRVRVNDGTGGLKARNSLSASSGLSQGVLADFNDDHRLDLVVSNTATDALLLYPGADNGSMGGVCVNGTNAGRSCTNTTQCPQGTCKLTEVLLTAGRCKGGAADGQVCATDSNCPGGGSCRLAAPAGTTFSCLGGTGQGQACTQNADCPGNGICRPPFTCLGGSVQGKTCTLDKDCPGGLCRSPAGPEGVVAAHFDADALPDLAFANRLARTLGVLHNDTGTGLVPVPNSPFTTQDQPAYLLAGSLDGRECVGGPSPGASCSADPDCGIGGVCRDCDDLVVLEQGPLSCRLGSQDGKKCTTDNDCGGGSCRSDRGSIQVFKSICATGALAETQVIDLGTGHVPRGGLLADLDGDGHLDLVVADFVGNEVLLYTGTGTGQFAADLPSLSGLSSPAALALLNIDSSAGPKIDLAVLGFANNTVDLFRNISTSGDLNFAVVPGSPASPWRNISAMALFAADGSTGLDLALLSSTPPRLDVLSGTGTTFRALPPEPLSAPGRATGMTVTDLRQDGLLDLLVLDDDQNGSATPFISDLLGGQTERLPVSPLEGPVHAAVGPLTLHGSNDFDNDGVPDGADNCPARYNPPGCPANDPAHFPQCSIPVPCPSLSNALKGACSLSGAPCTVTADCGAGGTCQICRNRNPAGQCDNDDDEIGDQCEILDAACATVDTDLDLVPDYNPSVTPKTIDNCPTVANPGQADAERDGLGDACEGDYDHDGVPDRLDNCPTRYNPPGCPASDKVNFPQCFVDIPCPSLADQLKGQCTLSAGVCTTDLDCAPSGGTCSVCRHLNPAGQCDNDDNQIGDQCEILSAACTTIDTDVDLVPDYDPSSTPKRIDNCPWISNNDQRDFDGTCSSGAACVIDADCGKGETCSRFCSISGAACDADADCGTTGGKCAGNGVGDVCDGGACAPAPDETDPTCRSGPRRGARCLADNDCNAPVNDAVVVDWTNATGGALSFLIGDASGTLREAPASWSSIGGLSHPVAAVIDRFSYNCTSDLFGNKTCNSDPKPGVLVAERGSTGDTDDALKLFLGDGRGGFSPPSSPVQAQVPLQGDPILLLSAPEQSVCPNPWLLSNDPRYRFDDDGKISVIAVVEPGTSSLAVYLPSNEGPVPPPGNPHPPAPQGARCASGSSPGTVCTQDSDCAGGGICRSPLPLPSPPVDAAFVDLNQDGYLDLVALSSGDGNPATPNVTIYIGVGNGLFFTDPSLNPTDVPDGMTLLGTGNVNLAIDSTYPDLVLFDGVGQVPMIMTNVLVDRADIDRSGRVDGFDLALLARAFGAERGEDFTIEPDGTLLQNPDESTSPTYLATRLVAGTGVPREGMDLPSTSGSASGIFLCDRALQTVSAFYGLPVDINLDGHVDGTDLALLASKFGRPIP